MKLRNLSITLACTCLLIACDNNSDSMNASKNLSKESSSAITKETNKDIMPDSVILGSGIDTTGFDKSVRVQDDFYNHVNGTWLKETVIPSDKSNYSLFTKIADQAEIDIRTIIEESSKQTKVTDGSVAQKIRDYYNTYSKGAKNPKVDLAGLKDELELIDNIKNIDDFYKALGILGKIGISGPIGGYVYSDLKNPDVYEVYLSQSGLSLPDRDYYLEDTEQFAKGRELYKTYIETITGLTNIENGANIAKDILALEKKIATHMWPKEKNRNPDLRYNLKTLDELKVKFSGKIFTPRVASHCVINTL